MQIQKQSYKLGLIIGLLVGVVLAIPPTFSDWQVNPSALFQGEDGTNWRIVFETLFSWFWPIALVASLLATLVHAWIVARKGQR